MHWHTNANLQIRVELKRTWACRPIDDEQRKLVFELQEVWRPDVEGGAKHFRQLSPIDDVPFTGQASVHSVYVS